ncbi:MAG TPA: S4 domain-containing protein [Vicinamibacterales bacterium]|nr:S4 domain-containing protein [Vicinamibacterales bacterium]
MTVPLERALSKLGLATRTEARALIAEGRVRVNRRVVRDPDASPSAAGNWAHYHSAWRRLSRDELRQAFPHAPCDF